MHVVLHMGTLRGAGSARLGQRLLRGLCATRPAWVRHLSAWTPPDWPHPPPPGLDARHVMRPGALAKLWTENLTLRRALLRADALLSFGDTSLIGCPIRHVLLVQQALLVCPLDALPFSLPWRWRLKLSVMQAYLRLGAPSVTAFVVQSPWMRDRLCATLPALSPARVHVIPSPLDVPPPPPPPQPTARPLAAPLVACVTGPGPHKHLALLPPLLRSLPAPVTLAVTVSPREAPALRAEAARLGVSDRLHMLGRLPHAQALGLMARADVCLQASLLESFSYPLHEALSLGRPIVAPDLPYARAAADDAALYAAPPTSPAAFADAIRRALTPATAADLRQRALRRAALTHLTPADAAARHWHVLSTL